MPDQAKRSTFELINDGKVVTLSDGSEVKIKPWGLAHRHRLIPILAKLTQEVMANVGELKNLDVAVFLLRYSKELDELLQVTLGWDSEQMDAIPLLEDWQKLQNAMLTVCVIREDGGGPLGEHLRLYTVGNAMLRTVFSQTMDEIREAAQEKTSSTTPSEPSSRAATVLEKSETTRPN